MRCFMRDPLPSCEPYHLRHDTWGRFSPAIPKTHLQGYAVKAGFVIRILVSEINPPSDQRGQSGLVEVIHPRPLVAIENPHRERLPKRESQAGLERVITAAQLRQLIGYRLSEV